jgi:hypothetical protein
MKIPEKVKIVLFLSAFIVPFFAAIVYDEVGRRKRANKHIVTIEATLITGDKRIMSFYVPKNYRLGIGEYRGSYWLYSVDVDEFIPIANGKKLRNGIIDYKVIKP